MEKIKKKLSITNLTLIWLIGIAGQICWNLENQWFNMFVYKYFGFENGTDIITGMVIVSSIATAISTFIFGTLSDRVGKRKPFIAIGYICWGLFTIIFGFTNKLNGISNIFLAACLVILADAIMSFFGSMGNDTGFNAWTTDLLNKDNENQIGIALAAQPVVGTIAGTVVGGIVVNSILGYVGFFTITGIIVMIIGLISLLTLKEETKNNKKIEGTFFNQLKQIFNFKEYFKLKELVLVNTILSCFFIGFNCFFNYIGNMFVYNFEFNEAEFGYVQGVALVLAIVIMIFITSLIKGNKSPLLTLLSIIFEISGLIVLTIVTSTSFFNNSNLLDPINIILFIGVILVGVGYVTFMQTIMVWSKTLYPEEKRGQFEGIRIIYYVLIPMIISSILSKVLISTFGIEKTYFDSQALIELTGKVPNESLFIGAIVFMLISLIPLFFVNKKYKDRIKNKGE